MPQKSFQAMNLAGKWGYSASGFAPAGDTGGAMLVCRLLIPQIRF